jgi:putative oxidoreductase
MPNFDLSNGYVVLRLICGLFIIPHAIGKITAHAAVRGFFTAAGFRPVGFWLYLTMAVEWVLAIGMVLGVYTRYVAALTAIFMVVAALANLRVCKGKWLWNLGGSEYPLFWAICCAIVAMHPS